MTDKATAMSNIDSLIKRLEEYIEYAEAVKRYADVSFYKELQNELIKHYKIKGTIEAWESRLLGADERYAVPVVDALMDSLGD